MNELIMIGLGVCALGATGMAGLALGVMVGKRSMQFEVDSYKANLAAMLGYDVAVEQMAMEQMTQDEGEDFH